MQFHPQTSLAEFFDAYDAPTVQQSPQTAELCRDLIREECGETLVELGRLRSSKAGSDAWHHRRATLAQELADLVYVACYTAHAYGINLGPVLDAVHASNLDKVWDDGLIHRDETGKVLKPPNWKKPDIGAILREDLDRTSVAAGI